MMSAPRNRQIAIMGAGFITSIGNDYATVFDSLLRLKHGFSSVTFFDGSCPIRVAGKVKDFNVESPSYLKWTWPETYIVPRDILRGMPPHGLYAYCAAIQAIASAGFDVRELATESCGLYCASAGSPMLMHHYLTQMQMQNGRRGHPMGVVSSVSGTLNFNLGAAFGIKGANCGFTSACASSSHALGYALDELRLGRISRALIVAAEDLNAESLLPFLGMRALSQNPDTETISRPFDSRRDGFVGCGGAVAIVLETVELAVERNRTPWALLSGWGHSSDGYNIMIAHPDGAGLAQAMKRAAIDANVDLVEIDYINAHATSTIPGDISEAQAIKRLFSSNNLFPYVSSTKAITGHGLSMAGALETAICALALKEGIIPGAANLTDVDPRCSGLNFPTNTLRHPVKHILSNSCGFGGSNVSLILSVAGR